jgi:hypothetical protein
MQTAHPCVWQIGQRAWCGARGHVRRPLRRGVRGCWRRFRARDGSRLAAHGRRWLYVIFSDIGKPLFMTACNYDIRKALVDGCMLARPWFGSHALTILHPLFFLGVV